jgi:hypothetical protein
MSDPERNCRATGWGGAPAFPPELLSIIIHT